MKKIVVLITIFVFFISCNLKRENQTVVTSENLTIDRDPTMQIIDSIGRDVDKDIVGFKNDILNFVEKKRTILRDSSLLAKALSGDVDAYYRISFDMAPATVNDSNFYKYSYYMAQKYGHKSAYSDVFLDCGAKSAKYYKDNNYEENNDWPLDYIGDNQKKLALSCLICSYKEDSPWAAKIFAYYFRNGYYFPKNIEIANKLDSIYKKAFPPFDGE